MHDMNDILSCFSIGLENLHGSSHGCHNTPTAVSIEELLQDNMSGEKSSSSLGTGFTTFAKCKEIQPLFHAVTTSTDTLTIWGLKSIMARLQARISQWKGRQWLMKATVSE